MGVQVRQGGGGWQGVGVHGCVTGACSDWLGADFRRGVIVQDNPPLRLRSSGAQLVLGQERKRITTRTKNTKRTKKGWAPLLMRWSVASDTKLKSGWRIRQAQPLWVPELFAVSFRSLALTRLIGCLFNPRSRPLHNQLSLRFRNGSRRRHVRPRYNSRTEDEYVTPVLQRADPVLQ